jgi:hypothetical protein
MGGIPAERWAWLIETGTGLKLRVLSQSDLTAPLRPFDARQASWSRAQPLIEGFETRAEVPGDPLRFAVLRLADLAVALYREGSNATRPARLSTVIRRLDRPGLSPRGDFSLVHHQRQTQRRTPPNPGRPSYAAVLEIVSGLAWWLTSETNRPRFGLVANLLRAVWPPIFVLSGKRAAWRQLSDAVSKHRVGQNGEEDCRALERSMAQALRLAP